jgi:hypothetical protein
MCSDGDMMSNMHVTCDPYVQKPFKNTSIISILINDKGKNKTQKKIFKKNQIKINKTKIIREYRQHFFLLKLTPKKELLVIVLKESYSKSKGNALLQKSL